MGDMNCLYCPNPLNGSDEHIILSAIGGRKSSTQILCSRCNNEFGSTIDATLLEALQYFTLIINPPSRRRDNAQKLLVTDDKGDVYQMRAGGKLKIPMKKTQSTQWVADASDAAYLHHHAQQAANAMQQRTGNIAKVTSASGEQKPGPFILPVQIDNFVAARAMLKWALNLLGVHVLTTDALRGPHVLEIERQFVAGANATPLAGYLERSLIPKLYDGLLHYALAIQTPNGSVYWEASAYGGVVAVSGRTAPISMRFSPLLYVVDPVTGEHSLANVTVNGVLSDGECHWMAQPAPAVHERIGKAGARLMELMNTRVEGEKIIGECMEAHWPRGIPLTQEHVDAVSRCIAEKYMELTRQVRALGEGGASKKSDNRS
jgi:hypothetical protein